MDKWNQELIDVITRSRNVIKRESKAASVQPATSENMNLGFGLGVCGACIVDTCSTIS
jgi:hypothetical protein